MQWKLTVFIVGMLAGSGHCALFSQQENILLITPNSPRVLCLSLPQKQRTMRYVDQSSSVKSICVQIDGRMWCVIIAPNLLSSIQAQFVENSQKAFADLQRALSKIQKECERRWAFDHVNNLKLADRDWLAFYYLNLHRAPPAAGLSGRLVQRCCEEETTREQRQFDTVLREFEQARDQRIIQNAICVQAGPQNPVVTSGPVVRSREAQSRAATSDERAVPAAIVRD